MYNLKDSYLITISPSITTKNERTILVDKIIDKMLEELGQEKIDGIVVWGYDDLNISKVIEGMAEAKNKNKIYFTIVADTGSNIDLYLLHDASRVITRENLNDKLFTIEEGIHSDCECHIPEYIQY